LTTVMVQLKGCRIWTVASEGVLETARSTRWRTEVVSDSLSLGARRSTSLQETEEMLSCVSPAISGADSTLKSRYLVYVVFGSRSGALQVIFKVLDPVIVLPKLSQISPVLSFTGSVVFALSPKNLRVFPFFGVISSDNNTPVASEGPRLVMTTL